MATINTGKPIRITAGCVLKIGPNASSLDTVAHLEAGTLRMSIPGRGVIHEMDLDSLGVNIPGDERPNTANLSVKLAPASFTESPNSILTEFLNEFSSGDIVEKVIQLTYYDVPGGSTGTIIQWNNCVFPDGLNLNSRADRADLFEVSWTDYNLTPSFTDF